MVNCCVMIVSSKLLYTLVAKNISFDNKFNIAHYNYIYIYKKKNVQL